MLPLVDFTAQRVVPIGPFEPQLVIQLLRVNALVVLDDRLDAVLIGDRKQKILFVDQFGPERPPVG